MNQELATQNTNKSMITPMDGPGQTPLSSNNVLPYVLLLQGLSELVVEEKASPGQIVRSTNCEVLGGAKSPVEFIPLTFFDTWVIYLKNGNKFVRTEPRTAANQDLPWDFTELGAEHRRVQCFNVFALLKKDVDTALQMLESQKNGDFIDPDKALLPVLITFRNTSFNAGKAVSTYFSKAKSVGSPAYVKSLKLGCHQDSNDKGKFWVYDISEGTMQPKESRDIAAQWYGTIVAGMQAKSIKMDDAGATKSEETATRTGKSKF